MYSGILVLCIAITGGVVYGNYILGVNLCAQPLNLHRHVMAQDLRLQICEHGTGSYTCGEDPIDQTPFHYAGPQLSCVIYSKHPHTMVQGTKRHTLVRFWSLGYLDPQSKQAKAPLDDRQHNAEPAKERAYYVVLIMGYYPNQTPNQNSTPGSSQIA